MRTAITDGTRLTLFTYDGTPQIFDIQKTVGSGASCIVYEALAHTDTTRLVRIKELYPMQPFCRRSADGTLLCEDAQAFQAVSQQFETAYRLQADLRLDKAMANQIVLAEGLYSGYGTKYLVTAFTNGCSYDKCPSRTLYDALRTAKAITEATAKYHRRGLLHLDLKPANIFVLPETLELVLLFDFNSVLPQCALTNTSISYSQQWAAPELRQGKRQRLCPATDLYSIGAILFYQVFQRHPAPADRELEADWRFDIDSAFFKNVNPRVFPLLKTLFHRTISANYRRRYATAQELLAAFEELLVLANPKEPYLRSNCPDPEQCFIGREAELTEIAEALQTKDTLFLSGIGGIGKSELAINYAKNADYEIKLFAEFTRSLQLLINDDFKLPIANLARVPEESEENYCRRRLHTFASLCCRQKTLLILDNINIDEFEGIEADFWKTLLALPCKKLITTRLNAWDAPTLCVEALRDKNKLLELFSQYSPLQTEEERLVAEGIIAYLNGHTLAVELVARKIRASDTTAAQLLAQLKQQGLSTASGERVASDKNRAISRKNAFSHILALFDLAELTPQQIYLLANMSLLLPEGISEKRLKRWLSLKSLDDVNELAENGWLFRRGKNISLHPVISDVAFEALKRRPTDCEPLLKVMQTALRDSADEERTVRWRTKMVSLAVFAAHRLLLLPLRTETCAASLLCAAEALRGYGRLQDRLRFTQEALAIRREVFQTNSPECAEAALHCGSLCSALNDYDAAEGYYREALQIRQALYGEAHKNIAAVFNMLANLYRTRERFDEAEVYYRKALDMRIALFGEQNEDTAASFNNLAVFYYTIGRLDEAEEYYRKALAIQTALFGDQNASSALYYNNIAELCLRRGRFSEAEPYYHKALEIRRALYGETAEAVAVSYIYLAMFYQETAEFSQAEAYYLKALHIRQTLSGEESDATAAVYNNLGILYQDMHRFSEAEVVFRKALDALQNLYGDRYSSTVRTLNNIGVLYREIRNYPAAEQALKRAVSIYTEIYGAESLTISATCNALGKLYFNTGDLESAALYCEKSLAIRKKLFGENNYRLKKNHRYLAMIYQAAGDFHRAIYHTEREIALFKLFPEAKPDRCNELEQQLAELRNRTALEEKPE